MIAINYARLKCTYCFTIDAITLALIIMAFINPIYALPAAFAFGFSYVGAGYEAVYQADHYNFFSASVLAFIHLVYWAGIAVSFVLLFFHRVRCAVCIRFCRDIYGSCEQGKVSA